MPMEMTESGIMIKERNRYAKEFLGLMLTVTRKAICHCPTCSVNTARISLQAIESSKIMDSHKIGILK